MQLSEIIWRDVGVHVRKSQFLVHLSPVDFHTFVVWKIEHHDDYQLIEYGRNKAGTARGDMHVYHLDLIELACWLTQLTPLTPED